MNTLVLKILGGVGIAALIFGAGYYTGYSHRDGIARADIAQNKAQVIQINRQAEQKSAQIKQVIKTQFITKTDVVYRTNTVTKQVIKQKIVPQFILTKGWVYTHDQLAKNQPVQPELAADSTPSEWSDKDALQAISSNYPKYHVARLQVQGWNQWYQKNQESINEINK